MRIRLWNWAECINGGFGLPPECRTDEDNHPSDALREFCDGYMKAHLWLDSLWNDLVFQDVLDFDPDDERLMEGAKDSETLDLLMTYAFLSDAGDFYSSSENFKPESPDDEFLDDIFGVSFNLLPALMLVVALAGRHFDDQNIAGNSPPSLLMRMNLRILMNLLRRLSLLLLLKRLLVLRKSVVMILALVAVVRSSRSVVCIRFYACHDFVTLCYLYL